MVLHSWIVECLGMVGVREQINYFLSERMKEQSLDLTCNSQSLGGVDIKQGIDNQGKDKPPSFHG